MPETIQASESSGARKRARKFTRTGILLALTGIAVYVLQISSVFQSRYLTITSGLALIGSALALHKAGTYRMIYAKGAIAYLIIALILLGIGLYWLIA